MSTDFNAVLAELQANTPTQAIFSNTLKNISIHVLNPNGDVDHQKAEYTASNGAHVQIIETTYGGGWGSVSHEVINLDKTAIYLEGDSEGYTYVNNGLGAGHDAECKDNVNGDYTHVISTNTGHFTTTKLYVDWGPNRSFTDILRGNAGNDILDGKLGNDTLWGADGNDILRGGTGSDALHGGKDIDFLFGQDGNDTLNGDAGDDYLEGGAGNDVLYGDAGDDYLEGGAGNDVMHGGADNDTYIFRRGYGSDTISEETTPDDTDTADALYLMDINDLFVAKLYDNLVLLFSTNADDTDSVTIENWFSAGKTHCGLDYVAIPDLNAAYFVKDIAGIAVDVTPAAMSTFSLEVVSSPLASLLAPADLATLTPVNVELAGISSIDDVAAACGAIA